MAKDAALKMAIELMERFLNYDGISSSDYIDVCDACKEALATNKESFTVQPAQMYEMQKDGTLKVLNVFESSWQGLTDDEIVEFACEYGLGTDMPKSEEYPLGILWYDGNCMEFARAIEQALKAKNG